MGETVIINDDVVDKQLQSYVMTSLRNWRPSSGNENIVIMSPEHMNDKAKTRLHMWNSDC